MSLCKAAVIARSQGFPASAPSRGFTPAWVGFEHEQVAGRAAAACDLRVPGS